MVTLEDARGRTITLHKPPQRIVSLVPSQTELLSSLGLRDEVVGVTRFCVHPDAWRKSKRIVGGTKLLRIDRIQDLRPDLILANLEENTKEDVERVEEIAPVYVTNVRTIDEAVDMIDSIALLVDRKKAGDEITTALRDAFSELADEPDHPLRAAYLIWRDPYMTVGGDTFIHDIMRHGGFANVFKSSMRYPELSVADLIDADPEVVLLPSEPFPFLEKHVPEVRQMLPKAQIHLVDGQLFSWYGSRLIHTPDYLRRLRQEIGVEN